MTTPPTPFYTDDHVTIYHGDSREILPVLNIESDTAVIVTDPPYGETSLSWDAWPTGWIDTIPISVRQMWCFGSMRTFLAHHTDFDAWSYSQEVVWEKHNGSGFAADRFKRVHEFATHWYRGRWSTLKVRPVMTNTATARQVRRKNRPPHTGKIAASIYASTDGGPKLERSVIYVRSCHGHAIHPTEKPVGILEPLIRYSTDRNDLIIDPFMGSGSTLDAARQNGRKAIGIETNETYCRLAADRLAQGTLAL